MTRTPIWMIGLLSACLLLFTPNARAWQWSQRQVEKDSLLLGESLRLRLSVLAAPGEELRWPLPGKAQLGGWRLLGADSLVEETRPEGRLVTRVLQVARYRLGEAALPTPGPAGGDSLQVDSLRVMLLSQLPDSAQAADILEPSALPHSLWWWLSRAGALLALLLAAWWAWRRWKARGVVEKAPVIVPADPWKDFEAELLRIDELGLWRVDRTEEHYARLSLALRGLLEDCLGLPCRERSTEELRSLLRESPLSDGDLAELLRLLEENDWVKYARRWPQGDECSRQSARYRAWAELRRGALKERHQQILAQVDKDKRGEAGA